MKTSRYLSLLLAIGSFLAVGCVLPDMVEFSEEDATEFLVENIVREGAEELVTAVPETTGNSIARISEGGDEFTLAWDPPSEGSVAAYTVYYRIRGDAEWLYLESIVASDTPSYTITATLFPAGEYEFGVSSVDPFGNESDIHTSLDETADPPTGWFLAWDPE